MPNGAGNKCVLSCCRKMSLLADDWMATGKLLLALRPAVKKRSSIKLSPCPIDPVIDSEAAERSFCRSFVQLLRAEYARSCRLKRQHADISMHQRAHLADESLAIPVATWRYHTKGVARRWRRVPATSLTAACGQTATAVCRRLEDRQKDHFGKPTS